MDEAAFKRLISGERRGLTATALRCGLRVLSVPYRGAVGLRNAMYAVGAQKSHRTAVPVISVGNLTAGGTGKTPLVAYLANHFQQAGKRAVLLSRGYKSLPGEVNDEKLVLDRLCPGVPHIQQPDRVSAAAIAIREQQAEVLILDDGFQHRRLHRDLDIVLIDATCPWGFDAVLPRGLLREPVNGLKRAHCAVITRVDLVDETQRQAIRDRIQKVQPRLPIAEVSYPPNELLAATGESQPLSAVRGQTVCAFCGIGNPSAFRQNLKAHEVIVPDDAFLTFPDHHHYTSSELKAVLESAQKHKASAVLTTLKDLVKVDPTLVSDIPLWAVNIGVEFDRGRDDFHQLLQSVGC